MPAELRCVICNDPFVRETRGPVVTCHKEECKYLNSRVTRMNASRKQRGLGRACGRCGTDLPAGSRSHYCATWCGPFRRTVSRRDGGTAGAPPEPAADRGQEAPARPAPRRGRPPSKVLGLDVSSLPEPHRSIVRMRFGNPDSIPMTLEEVASVLRVSPAEAVAMETEALEAMGNGARGNNAKRWRYS